MKIYHLPLPSLFNDHILQTFFCFFFCSRVENRVDPSKTKTWTDTTCALVHVVSIDCTRRVQSVRSSTVTFQHCAKKQASSGIHVKHRQQTVHSKTHHHHPTPQNPLYFHSNLLVQFSVRQSLSAQKNLFYMHLIPSINSFPSVVIETIPVILTDIHAPILSFQGRS